MSGCTKANKLGRREPQEAASPSVLVREGKRGDKEHAALTPGFQD